MGTPYPMSRIALVLLLALPLAACGTSAAAHEPTAKPTAAEKAAPPKQPPAAKKPKLPWGATSASAILPGDVLIADSHNNRILLVSPQKQIVWQYPAPGTPSPIQDDDDVFFSPTFNEIITNEEGSDTLAIVDFKTRKVVWTYGHQGAAGSAAGYLNTPDDAFLYNTAQGQIITVADIKNQRILFINRATHQIIKQYGRTGVYSVNPPTTFGAPNGDFPAPNGSMLVTQIGGNDAILLNRQGQIQYTVHFPSYFSYPSDANFTPDGNIICAFYTSPGAIVLMSPQGKVLWQYQVTSGPGALNHPSLAVELPNGLVMLNDDYNDRVVIIDPRTNQIVWQYGHTGVPGTAPGFLNTPDGMDLLPNGVVPGAASNPVGGHLWSYPGNGY